MVGVFCRGGATGEGGGALDALEVVFQFGGKEKERKELKGGDQLCPRPAEVDEKKWNGSGIR